ncbi:polysialyltransferase family glycosyltransferase [Vibrio breoganii]
MKNLYLIRNLLSLKAAKAIDEQYHSNESIYSIIEGNSQLSNIIISNLNENKDSIVPTINFRLYKVGINIFKQRKNIGDAKKEIEIKLRGLSVSKLFITYPMHFDSYMYYLTARKMGITICFYEEGPCFYRGGLTKQYEIKNTKDLLRKIYYSMCGLRRGYDFKADCWYSSLPIKDKHKSIRLQYERVQLPLDVKYVFLSRPVSDDYQELDIRDEVNAIMKFYNLACGSDPLYIKFHPRESDLKRSQIRNMLFKSNINIKILEKDCPSEDIIYSMKNGAVCGYDTTTLVYANNINDKIEVYSVLKSIAVKDTTGFLLECYEEYKLKYKHIRMCD